MKIHPKDFRVRPGDKLKLNERPTKVKPFFKLKKQNQQLLEEHVEEMSALQQLHRSPDTLAALFV